MTPFAGWMRFDWLPERQGLAGVFTLGWKILDEPDEWSRRFGRFKERDVSALWGAAAVMQQAFPELAQGLQIDGGRTAVVCALGSSDEVIDGRKPVPRLAKACAKLIGADYAGDTISKRRHRPIHSVGNAGARQAELNAAQYACSMQTPPSTVIVFDDLVTRGGTLSKVAQAVRARRPNATVYGVALGKHERRGFNPAATNDSLTPQWNALWLDGEQRYREHKAG